MKSTAPGDIVGFLPTTWREFDETKKACPRETAGSTAKEIRALASLARLSLRDEEVAAHAPQVSQILKGFGLEVWQKAQEKKSSVPDRRRSGFFADSSIPCRIASRRISHDHASPTVWMTA